MANCKFCGKPVSLLKSRHKECLQKFISGKEQIPFLVEKSFKESAEPSAFGSELKNIRMNNFIGGKLAKELVINGWENAVEKAFEDGVLSVEEEQWLSDFADFFKLSQENLNTNGSYTKLVQGSILREIVNGDIPKKINIEGNLPFNFQKDEKIVWVFQNVEYFEQKTRKQFVGGYSGISLRVAKGIYYRTGGFKGHPVQTVETVKKDTGLLCVTDKHLYFGGSNKNFRIKYDKIVSFTPYSNGIGIQRDAATAIPQSFVTGEGWFTSNLIANIAKI